MTAGVAGVVAALLFPVVRMWIVKQRLRRYYREVLGSNLPFNVQVELTPEGVLTRQKTGQASFEWQQVESIRETADSIDIYTRYGGIVVVRKREFASAQEIQQFVQEAESHRALAREHESS